MYSKHICKAQKNLNTLSQSCSLKKWIFLHLLRNVSVSRTWTCDCRKIAIFDLLLKAKLNYLFRVRFYNWKLFVLIFCNYIWIKTSRLKYTCKVACPLPIAEATIFNLYMFILVFMLKMLIWLFCYLAVDIICFTLTMEYKDWPVAFHHPIYFTDSQTPNTMI